MLTTYAQNREDLIIKAFFKDIEAGFYVDVGANHPVEDSVTKLFYQNGWYGINVEPNQYLHELLQLDRPKDFNCNFGIGEKPGSLTLREYKNHGLSTFSEPMQEQYEHDQNELTDVYTEYEVPIMTLGSLFKEQKVGHIHFMKVDVEGYEYEALAGNDWSKYRPELLCIESNHIIHDWRPLLAEQSYEKVFFDGLNDYYLSKEALFRKDIFSYPEALLLSGKVVPWDVRAGYEQVIIDNKLLEFQWDRELQKLHNQEPGFKHQLRILIRSFDRAVINRLNGDCGMIPSLSISSDNAPTMRNKIVRAFFAGQQTRRERFALKGYLSGKRLIKVTYRALVKILKRKDT